MYKKIFFFFLIGLWILLSAINFLSWELFLWWDNSRLFIYYPELYSKFILSWGINFSDFPLNGSYKPIYHLIFITKFLEFLKLYIWTYLLWVIVFFSINLSWFLGIYKLLSLFDIKKENTFLRFILWILYITSSLVFINFNSFFAGVFLIGTWPFLMYHFLKYSEEGKPLNLLWFWFITLFFGVSFYAIPWIIPIILITLMILFIRKKYTLKRIVNILLISLLLSFYWLIPFILQFQEHQNHYEVSEIKNSFNLTVNNTSRDNNIIYPLWIQIHPSIAKNYKWEYYNIYQKHYKYTLFLTLIIFWISLLWIIKSPKKETFTIFSIFLLFLFLYTVNIGFLKEVFLSLNNIPWFWMYRNFYDKLGISYSIILIIVLYLGLSNIHKIEYIKGFLIFSTIIISIPFISWTHLSHNIWKTNESSLIDDFNEDYFEINSWLGENNSIFWKNLYLPLSISQYNTIKWNTNGTYIGLEPSYILNWVKTIVSNKMAMNVYNECINRSANTVIQKCFDNASSQKNIEYVIINKDYNASVFIYNWVTNSNTSILKDYIINNYPIVFENTTYRLYKIYTEWSSFNNFSKMKPYKYIYHWKNINSIKISLPIVPSNLWLINIRWENTSLNSKSIFFNNLWESWNKWEVSKELITSHINKNYKEELLKDWYPKKLENGRTDYKYYTENTDGSINIEFVLYFKAQLYFYIWLIISGSTFALLILWLILNSIYTRKRPRHV